VIALDVQDEASVRVDQIQSEYQPAIRVTVEGQPKLVIYERAGAEPLREPPDLCQTDTGSSATVCPIESLAGLFDRGTTPDRVASLAPEVKVPMPGKPADQEYIVGGFARLLGYRVKAGQAFPGGYVDLTLVWEVLSPPATDYTVFTHLSDGLAMRGQLDGQPVCGSRPTTSWQTGEIIVDPYRIPIRDDAPLETIPLTVGMYDGQTGERLPVVTSEGVAVGDSLPLAGVVVRAP
jgi:hypothetical protein